MDEMNAEYIHQALCVCHMYAHLMLSLNANY